MSSTIKAGMRSSSSPLQARAHGAGAIGLGPHRRTAYVARLESNRDGETLCGGALVRGWPGIARHLRCFVKVASVPKHVVRRISKSWDQVGALV